MQEACLSQYLPCAIAACGADWSRSLAAGAGALATAVTLTPRFVAALALVALASAPALTVATLFSSARSAAVTLTTIFLLIALIVAHVE